MHRYGPVVMILEQFEVQLSKTLPPAHFLKMSPTHEAWSEGLEWSDRLRTKYKLKFRSFWGHLCWNSAEISTSVLIFMKTGKKSTILSHFKLRQYFSIRSSLPQRYIPRLDGNEDRDRKNHFWDAYGRVKDDSGVPLSMGGSLFHKLKKMQTRENNHKHDFL